MRIALEDDLEDRNVAQFSSLVALLSLNVMKLRLESQAIYSRLY